MKMHWLKKIDWPNHFVGLMMVFVGITLAFALDRWNENAKTRVVEQKYLQSFRDDLELDNQDLDMLIANTDTIQMRIQHAVQLMQAVPAQPDSVALLLGNMLQLAQLNTKLSTYESIKSSGNLGILSDYDLKQAIADYYQYSEQSLAALNAYNVYVEDLVIPFYLDAVDFSQGTFVDASTVKNYKTRNIALGYLTLVQQNIEFYKAVQMRCKKVQTLLNRAIQ